MAPSGAAAFIRLEGTLVDRGAVSAAAYFASNGAGLRERAVRLGSVAMTAPLYRVLGQADRTLANRLAYVCLRNMSEDRIVELAREYYEDVLREHVLDSGVELLRRVRREGHRIVLLSDGLQQVVEPLVAQLRVVDDFVCNRLEFRHGVTTGRLLEPIVGGHASGKWAQRYCQEHGVSLEQSMAFAAHGPDLLWMSTGGHPCAVNPDYTLRRAAREADWPVMDYNA